MKSIANRKVLSVFSLVMINVIAVDSLRTLPIGAEYGFSLVFFYLLAGLTFFIPTALVSAELATGWPVTGGLYIWVREAFGPKIGFLAIWLQWIYNVVWYPTILAFLAGTVAYLFKPELIHSKTFMLSSILILFWGTTFINCLGMRVSSVFSTISALIGTLIPMLFIIVLGIFWLIQGNPSAVSFDLSSFFPGNDQLKNLAFFSAVLFGLIGLEMSAVHAEEVKTPARDYPRALLYSAVIILASLMLASLAIALVIPVEKLNLVSGLIDAFAVFFNQYHLAWMIPVIAGLIILGALGCVSAWVIGPTKGLMAAAKEKCISDFFATTNSKGAPVIILIAQAILVTLLSSLFLLLPSVNSSYWILSALTAQLALLVYILLFASAIKLRYSHAHVKRAYRIPGGNFSMWIIGIVGILACVAGIMIGFMPPDAIPVGDITRYEVLLVGGIILLCLPPFVLYKLKNNRNI